MITISKLSLVLTALVAALFIPVIISSGSGVAMALGPASACRGQLTTLPLGITNVKALSPTMLQAFTECIAYKAEALSASEGTLRAVANVQQVTEGCIVFVIDGVLRAWYEPTTAFGGNLFVGDSTFAYTGSYVGLPVLYSVGSVSVAPGALRVYTFFGFAIIASGSEFAPGFWLRECDIERPI